MNKLFCVLIFVMTVVSCDSILDLQPKNAVTFDHYFRNEKDLEALVTQMHADMRAVLGRVSFQEHMGMKVDRVHGSDGSNFEKVRNLDPNIIANRSYQQQWKSFYNVISLTDLFFDNYKKAEGISQNREDFWKGQSYFIRSVCYFYLTRTWGDVVITKGSTYTGKYAKSPASEVLDSAIVFAERAYQLLPVYSELKGSSNRRLLSKQYGCKGSAAGLLTHLYAWKGSLSHNDADLAEAVKWADKLLDEKNPTEVGTYTLAANPEEVCEKVMRRCSDESIFELEISYTDNSTYGNFLPGAYLVGWPVKKNVEAADIIDAIYGIYASTVNTMYEKTDRRRTAYFYEPDATGLNTGGLAYLYKWRYPLYRETPLEIYLVGLDANRVLIRLADILLLRAECRAKLNDLAGAKSDLKVIRERAGATLFPGASGDEDNKDGLLYAIFKEREKELLYEGGRYYDVVRNGYYRTELSEAFTALTDADVKNGALYLPIPETAFMYNDLMVQNTYWLSKMK